MRAMQWARPRLQSINRKQWLCGVLVARMGLAFQVSDPDSLATPIENPASDSLATSNQPAHSDESRVTSFTFSGGGGTYFREAMLTVGQTECGPQSVRLTGKSEFKEIGAAIDHQGSKRFHVGVRGGYVWTSNSFVGGYDTTLTDLSESQNFGHVNPYVAVEWKYFGAGLGGVFSSSTLHTGETEDIPVDDDADAELSGHVRVGSLSSVYANVTCWEGTPLLSNGHITLGAGVRPVQPLEVYAGFMTDGPYQDDAWMGRVTVDANSKWSFYLNLRFPEDYNGHGEQYGTAIGATYHNVR